MFEKYRLKEDIYSHYSKSKSNKEKKIYGKRGDIVTLTYLSDNMTIVESESKIRFPVKFEKLELIKE